ncbi:MAG: recombinase family protein [Nostoc sp.]|uniref:recombinase family protein n=1 Tax=Nostoc sp. TaxID=1180 RepID=UPI002FFB2253
MTTNQIQAAIYARVSTEQQTETQTVASQLAALRLRVAADGLKLCEELTFIDAGYSGATLVRPALERLRDLAFANGVDRLYVHSPDRLARKYAYQVLLIDEMYRCGVEVIFLNRELGQSPEDDLLLQVQGMVAEYERAKIMERSRRGKRHAAKSGSVNVLSCAPYGYKYVNKADGGGQAHFELVVEQAQVVRQIFDWVGRERVTIGEVCRRLNADGQLTQTGKAVWDRSTVWGMLKNPAYIGFAAFGKTQVCSRRQRLKPIRGASPQPRRDYSSNSVDVSEWISVPVPKIVDENLFAAVQEQLQENQRRSRIGQRGARYLLQGLVTCKLCGYTYYGKAISNKSAKSKPRDYAYYRCIGTDAYRFGGNRVCSNTQVRTDTLETAVWQEVCSLLKNPQRLYMEYQRRGQEPTSAVQENIKTKESQIAKLRRGIARLIDSYAEGLIEKNEFEPRIHKIKERVAILEAQVKNLNDEATLNRELRLIIGRLEEFSSKVINNLDSIEWNSQREIIRLLVKRVEVDTEQVNVVFRVGDVSDVPKSESESLQDCRRGNYSPLGCSLLGKSWIDSCFEASEDTEF